MNYTTSVTLHIVYSIANSAWEQDLYFAVYYGKLFLQRDEDSAVWAVCFGQRTPEYTGIGRMMIAYGIKLSIDNGFPGMWCWRPSTPMRNGIAGKIRRKNGFTRYSFPCAENTMSVGPVQMRKRRHLLRK